MRRFAALAAGTLIAMVMAGPALATAPSTDHQRFTTDAYVVAECDGYDVLEQDHVDITIQTYFDRNGDVSRMIFHSSDTGIVWRSDTDEQLATYADAGGTFTQTSDGRFIWTGVHNAWTLTDGTTIRDAGRVVVAEVSPGQFERVFAAGHLPEPDPCSW
jgi:hypothetical protein